MAPFPPADRIKVLERLAVRDPAAAASVPELAYVNKGTFALGEPSNDAPLRVVIWNLHRGRDLERWVSIPAVRDADLLLLSEVDDGMARSGNVDVAAELAKRLSMSYAYSAEYFEFTRGTRAERLATQGTENARGLHGNAILSRWPLHDVKRLELPLTYDWYSHYERRIGTRIALVATLELPSGPLAVASTHLEAFASPADRAQQIGPLFDYVRGRRALVGGDLNTLGVRPDVRNAVLLGAQLLRDRRRLVCPEKHEPLFAEATRAGFEWRSANTRDPTWRPHPLLPSRLCARLDWALLRGVRAVPGSCRVLAASPPGERTRLSDHDGVGLSVATVLG